ncbi:MAG: hypothetical protein AB7O38_28595, partial [Pirellulaceae bacterium]
MQIDEICEAFEQAWSRGGLPRVGDFVSGVAAHDQLALLQELLALEVGLRSDRGDAVSADDLVQRYAPFWPETEAVDETLRSVVERAMSPTPANDETAAYEPLDAASTAPYLRGGSTSESSVPGSWPTIDGFEIESVLGRGGMGIVYKAWQKFPRRPVALKMIL